MPPATAPSSRLDRVPRGAQSKLRAWQTAALEAYRVNDPRDFLTVATPGAGKTTYALRLASDLLDRRVVERVVVVAPTEHLKTQWAQAAAAVGIPLDPEFSGARGITGSDYLGMVASIPPEDQFTRWRSEYEADILVSLASLAGERMFFDGEASLQQQHVGLFERSETEGIQRLRQRFPAHRQAGSACFGASRFEQGPRLPIPVAAQRLADDRVVAARREDPEPGQEVGLSRDHDVTAFATTHTIPSLGYLVWERRKKLKPEYHELTGEQIRDLRLEVAVGMRRGTRAGEDQRRADVVSEGEHRLGDVDLVGAHPAAAAVEVAQRLDAGHQEAAVAHCTYARSHAAGVSDDIGGGDHHLGKTRPPHCGELALERSRQRGGVHPDVGEDHGCAAWSPGSSCTSSNITPER